MNNSANWGYSPLERPSDQSVYNRETDVKFNYNMGSSFHTAGQVILLDNIVRNAVGSRYTGATWFGEALKFIGAGSEGRLATPHEKIGAGLEGEQLDQNLTVDNLNYIRQEKELDRLMQAETQLAKGAGFWGGLLVQGMAFSPEFALTMLFRKPIFNSAVGIGRTLERVGLSRRLASFIGSGTAFGTPAFLELSAEERFARMTRSGVDYSLAKGLVLFLPALLGMRGVHRALTPDSTFQKKWSSALSEGFEKQEIPKDPPIKDLIESTHKGRVVPINYIPSSRTVPSLTARNIPRLEQKIKELPEKPLQLTGKTWDEKLGMFVRMKDLDPPNLRDIGQDTLVDFEGATAKQFQFWKKAFKRLSKQGVKKVFDKRAKAKDVIEGEGKTVIFGEGKIGAIPQPGKIADEFDIAWSKLTDEEKELAIRYYWEAVEEQRLQDLTKKRKETRLNGNDIDEMFKRYPELKHSDDELFNFKGIKPVMQTLKQVVESILFEGKSAILARNYLKGLDRLYQNTEFMQNFFHSIIDELNVRKIASYYDKKTGKYRRTVFNALTPNQILKLFLKGVDSNLLDDLHPGRVQKRWAKAFKDADFVNKEDPTKINLEPKVNRKEPKFEPSPEEIQRKKDKDVEKAEKKLKEGVVDKKAEDDLIAKKIAKNSNNIKVEKDGDYLVFTHKKGNVFRRHLRNFADDLKHLRIKAKEGFSNLTYTLKPVSLTSKQVDTLPIGANKRKTSKVNFGKNLKIDVKKFPQLAKLAKKYPKISDVRFSTNAQLLEFMVLVAKMFPKVYQPNSLSAYKGRSPGTAVYEKNSGLFNVNVNLEKLKVAKDVSLESALRIFLHEMSHVFQEMGDLSSYGHRLKWKKRTEQIFKAFGIVEVRSPKSIKAAKIVMEAIDKGITEEATLKKLKELYPTASSGFIKTVHKEAIDAIPAHKQGLTSASSYFDSATWTLDFFDLVKATKGGIEEQLKQLNAFFKQVSELEGREIKSMKIDEWRQTEETRNQLEFLWNCLKS